MCVRRLAELPPDLEALAAEARGEGFHMLDRLAAEWASGENRFTGPGEALFGAFDPRGRLVAIGGITLDPSVAALRMRRFYVAPRARRAGLGEALARAALDVARDAGVPRLRLRAPATAFAFWQGLGFEPVIGDAMVTHERRLAASS